jgi:hypothetical protein
LPRNESVAKSVPEGSDLVDNKVNTPDAAFYESEEKA